MAAATTACFVISDCDKVYQSTSATPSATCQTQTANLEGQGAAPKIFQILRLVPESFEDQINTLNSQMKFVPEIAGIAAV
jgi:hypothetical protein